MRKLLLLVLVVSICGLVGCEESAGEKVERKVRNAVDDISK